MGGIKEGGYLEFKKARFRGLLLVMSKLLFYCK
ncbi:MAG: hypothetical protein UT41_C0001G0237 [Candidatus Wolfebacteria bacterium GW2011_GWC2_39_22]|uniref:Uncharacterized protein n=1 Tax=Candidatus Wolfebacteria bacterium GW2011_GWC2_39_22 TaxID=1619013 RepID=A0A0G0NB57_9BACT|nr:MAG: hypothetical protein UT41_C0001G0237 [Candidatus Wolfebacteria bacterium GW2011_GWC2_39_22]